MLKAVAIEKDPDQNQSNNWWERVDLNYEDGSLSFANQVVKDISNFEGPTYIYSKARIKDNLKRLHQALEDVNIQHQIHYAVKANRHPAILKTVKDTGYAGVDVCSPKELELATASGFKQNQINYTGTSISNSDYQLIANYTIFTLQCASALCHLIMNFIVIAIVYVFVGFCVSLKESNLISMLVIYFICGFEFVVHVLFWMKELFGV